MIHVRVGREEVPEVVTWPGGEREAVVNLKLIPEPAAAPETVERLVAFPDLQGKVTDQTCVVFRIKPTKQHEMFVVSTPGIAFVALHQV